MKTGTITNTVAAMLTLLSLLLLPAAAQHPVLTKVAASGTAQTGFDSAAMVYAPTARSYQQVSSAKRQFPWKKDIVTTIFWVGELPTANNPVPNRASSWDANWTQNFGGYDDPNPATRRDMIPIKFTPRQNPFYVALPYNDKARTGHRPEAPQVVPWFKEAYQGPAVSTCKGRWVAIRKGNKTAYAQWEDAGPFRTDHWQYVFGNERPKPNLNKGAGLDVSPAVRDFLGMQDTDVTDWKFVQFEEVPVGPWARHGDNNTFVINRRSGGTVVQRQR
ncbi:MAG: hypothetical protein M3372_08510 [Verrucomicrobiota bacterium]|nr:hypothetical protein [Verrucomicrobiota bacterium]